VTTWLPTQRAREREVTIQPHHFYFIRRPIGTERERESEREREGERERETTMQPPTLIL